MTIRRGLMPRMIVLEDEETVRKFVMRTAEDSGFAVYGVQSHASFFVAFNTHNPQVVVLDIFPGHEDVLRVVSFLHNKAFAGLVILMSGYDRRVLTAIGGLAEEHGLRVHAVIDKASLPSELKEACLRASFLLSKPDGTPGIPVLDPALDPALVPVIDRTSAKPGRGALPRRGQGAA